jgi:arsenite-transporting ATPase
MLEEDLRSPCTEEIAVFRAFARIVAQGKDRFVVLDTAPTGHTLLLLDATEAYHREIARKASNLPGDVLQLLPRLRDSDFTRVLIVTLPEATPVHEAAALQVELRRANIEPFAWIINQSFSGCGSPDPLLLAKEAGEAPYILEVTRKFSKRTAIVRWTCDEPVGPDKLGQLFRNGINAQHKLDMTTYVYEPVRPKSSKKPRYFEIKQNMEDKPLKKHPETGEPIRRVVLGGFGVLSSKPTTTKSKPPGSSCGPGCGCH